MSNAKMAFLAGGGLLNDIDSEANPESKQNNQWRDYAKALEAETNAVDLDSAGSLGGANNAVYEDFGAKAALKRFGVKDDSSDIKKGSEGSTDLKSPYVSASAATDYRHMVKSSSSCAQVGVTTTYLRLLILKIFSVVFVIPMQ